MNLKQKLTALLLLAVGAVTQLNAQVAVTVGSQVTDESNIVSGKAYILQSQAAGGNSTLPYINDDGTNYAIPNGNTCNESSVYYLISNGDGTWKIKNYYTNRYWGVPVYNQAIASVAEEASAGVWSLNFSNGIAYPSAPDAESTVRGLDRSSNKLWGYTTGTGGTKQVKIYEVGPTEKGLKRPVDIVSGWYLVKWVDINSDTNTNYSDADVNGKYIKNYAQDVTVNNNNYSLYLDEVPTGTDGIALSLVYFEKEGSSSGRGVDGYLRSANGHYVRQTGAASNSKAEKNYIIYRSSSTPNYSVVTSGYQGNRYSLIPCGKDATPYIGQTAQNKFPVAQFYSVDFSLYGLQPWSVVIDGVENAQVTYSGSSIYGLKSVYNGGTFFFANGVTPSASDFSAPKKLGFSPSISVDVVNHQIVVSYELISQVYTLQNIAGNYITYDPSQSSTALWSTGKSGATPLDTSNPNHQWVFIPTGTTDQFYLYNVGADMFAVPTGIAQSNSTPWVFSKNAVPISLLDQNDNTFKIRMAVDPVNGSNAAYMHVNNTYAAPVFNWNGDNSKFTITKVTGDASAAANAAVAKLVKSQTALTSYPQTTGWYVLQIKRSANNSNHVGRYVYAASSLYNNLYPLTFTGAIDVQPSITDPVYFTHINCTSWDVNTWQMPDGRYLVDNGSNKFPTASATAGNVIAGYDSGNYFKTANNYFADAYNSNANYFIGESTSFRTEFTVYPIDLDAAGLVAWQVLCDNAPESAQITCSRSDVKGLTAVYKNGFFFLPTGVTPESTDFNLDGANGVTIDGTAHTITFAYDPNLAIVADGVTVEQGWQTAGRDSEVMLLKVTAKPFKDATNTTLTVNLKDGSAANISTLKLYEANNNSPEIYSTGEGSPTKTEVATASISGSTATFTIGNLTAGTHYYWIGATVSSTATLGAVLDAAVTGIAYQVAGQTAQSLDLTSVGDPADRGAMVFNVRSYPFLPRDNGSRVYRIPAMIVADDGSIVVAADKRYQSHTDIGNGGHVIDIVVRRSTDGGKTWSEPVTIAKGEGSTASGGNDKRCGFGDPSLVKGKDGKLYCLFAAGNEGYFYGQKGMCMSVSTDNGVTWSSGVGNPPVDLYWSGAIKNVATAGAAGFGLYDYFVTSGRGLYIPEDDILMYLIPAQTMTSATEHTSNSQDYIFYSRDGGDSWYFSETPMVQGGDEAKIIQMNDGSLLGSIRTGGNRCFNAATYTKNDDGKTLSFNFDTQWNNSQVKTGAANNQDIFYYQRETAEGKTDVIIHSMTTGTHANLKLYYSTDQGLNWTEFLNVQTKGTRYVTMDKNPANGSLYLLFEDQSLNSAGGYTDYNHYPLNFLEITRDQLVALIPALEEYNVPEYLEAKDVKIVSGTSGEGTYGSWSGLTWTSNAASGVVGLTMTLSDGTYNRFSSLNGRYNLAYHPAAANTNSTLTLTAPTGYVITGYSVQTGVYQAATYTLTAEGGSSITPANLGSTYTPLEVSGLSATSTTITITTTDASKWLSLANFSVSLAKPFPLNVVGDKSYATLYLPFDVTTTGATKAYYIATANNGYAQLTATDNEGTEIPAKTAVVLVNEDADASTILNMTTGLSTVVEESANLLKGTLVPMSLDLSDGTDFYSLGRLEGVIGFYKFTGGTITLGANKAYLEVPASGGVKGFTFNFDDANSIVSPLGETEEGASIYNLAGQRLNRPTRGVNIVNGKKVIIK